MGSGSSIGSATALSVVLEPDGADVGRRAGTDLRRAARESRVPETAPGFDVEIIVAAWWDARDREPASLAGRDVVQDKLEATRGLGVRLAPEGRSRDRMAF